MGKITNIEAVDKDLNRTVLIEQWRRLYDCSPPKYLSLRLMQSALRWEEQARVMGGIAAKTLRTLHNAAEPKTVNTITTLNAGAVLVREWNGRTYQISVLEHGFCMDGKDYTSLTAIAQKITGPSGQAHGSSVLRASGV